MATKKKTRVKLARALKPTGVGFIGRHKAAKLLLRVGRDIASSEMHAATLATLGIEVVRHEWCQYCSEHCTSRLEGLRGSKGYVEFQELYSAAPGQI